MLLTFLLAALAAGPIPDTPKGRQAAGFVSAISTGERGVIESFIAAHFDADDLKRQPAAPRAERWTRLASEVGPLEVRRYRESPEGAELLVAARAGQLHELRIEMAEQPPFGIRGADLEPADADAGADVEPAADDDAFVARARELVTGLAARKLFAGAVLVARDGRVVMHEAFGLADRESGTPNGPETKFNIGSINKVFTQVAIGQLLEAGRIRLDDTIRTHVPDYPADPGDRITIRQLVTMRSGLGDFFGTEFDAFPKARLRSVRDYLPLFVSQPLRFEPGASQQYSNAGYVVLGLIVEAASGQTYYDYVRTHVFEPAGMRDTGSFAIDEAVADRATGYTGERSNRELLPARGSSAGGGYSTAGDLLRFVQALAADRLLSPAYTDWMLDRGEHDPRPAAAAPRGRRRAMATGWAGGTVGVNALLEVDLGRGITVVVLANQDPPAAERLGRRVRDLLPRTPGPHQAMP